MEKSIDVKIETSTWQTNVIKRMKERFFFFIYEEIWNNLIITEHLELD